MMKQFYLFLSILMLSVFSITSLSAQTNVAVTLGGNAANNELRIIVHSTGNYIIYRYISGSWRRQFFSETSTPLFTIKIGNSSYMSTNLTQTDVGTHITTGTQQEMTKRFTGNHGGQPFSVTIKIS